MIGFLGFLFTASCFWGFCPLGCLPILVAGYQRSVRGTLLVGSLNIRTTDPGWDAKPTLHTPPRSPALAPRGSRPLAVRIPANT
jgi:hypothetical protein